MYEEMLYEVHLEQEMKFTICVRFCHLFIKKMNEDDAKTIIDSFRHFF